MVVGELFVNLGIKGSDKTVSALAGVETQMKGLASMSLEAKAAIIGAMYAVEQLFARSGAQGTELTNFNALLGVSAKTLQQYQYAARQAGVSNEETASTFKNLQSTMTKTALGQGAPKGLGQVAMLTGGMTARDIQEYMKNPEKLLGKLQEYAQKEKRVGIRNETLKSFGLGDNMIAALARSAFKPETLSNAPIYGDKEVSALDKANIAWSNLGNTIQMAIGHLNAAHGGQIVKDFSILVNIGLKAADMLLRVIERFHVFEGLDRLFKATEIGASRLFAEIYKIGNLIESFSDKNRIFEGIADHFASIEQGAKSLGGYFLTAADAITKFAQESHLFEHMGNIFGDMMDVVGKLATLFGSVEQSLIGAGERFGVFTTIAQTLSTVLSVIESALKGIATALDIINGGPEMDKAMDKTLDALKGSQAGPGLLKLIESIPELHLPDIGSFFSGGGKPDLKLVPGEKPSQTINNINVDQDLHFGHDGKDHAATAGAVKKAVNDAFRQMPSQTQGS